MKEALQKMLFEKHILETYSSFLLVNRPGFRTKIIAYDLRSVYILRILQYIKVESNYSGAFYRNELRLYPLKSKRDCSPYSYVYWFCVIFNRSYFCFFSVHLFLPTYLCVISICFCIISLAIEVKVVVT